MIPDKTKSFAKGAILPLKGKPAALEVRLLEAVAENHGIDINTRFCYLSKEDKEILLYRLTDEVYSIRFKPQKKDICSRIYIAEV